MIDWKKVQAALGLVADGAAGPKTYAKLLDFAGHGRVDDALALQMGAICAVMFPRYGIDATANRLAQFLASTSHETGDYTTFSENLNYSVQNILDAWGPGKGGRFKSAADAAPYAHNPPKLAEKVYGGRFGNPPGRAYAFRGGGWIQTTFFDNYLDAEHVTGLPLTEHPELLHDPLTSIEPACAFWRAKGCNQLADGDPSGRKARVAVNGGTIGLSDVLTRLPRLLAALS
jgi:putative chitinase